MLWGLDITYGLVWYQIGQDSQGDIENSISETMRKATGKHLYLFFPRHGVDCAIASKDDGINAVISQGLVESCLARNSVRHSRSSSSKIFTVSREK